MRPGDRFAGRYVLTEVIGAGRNGDVWLAHDEVLGQDVALKPARAEGDGMSGSGQGDSGGRADAGAGAGDQDLAAVLAHRHSTVIGSSA